MPLASLHKEESSLCHCNMSFPACGLRGAAGICMQENVCVTQVLKYTILQLLLV